MEKKELFRIMAAADGSMLRELAQPLAEKYGVSVVKAPAKTLAMIKPVSYTHLRAHET